MTQRKVCQKLCTQPGGCLLYNMTSNLTTSEDPFCWLSTEIGSPELFFHQLKWVSFGFGAALGVILTIIVGCSIRKCMDCCEDDYEDVRAIDNSFSIYWGCGYALSSEINCFEPSCLLTICSSSDMEDQVLYILALQRLNSVSSGSCFIS